MPPHERDIRRAFYDLVHRGKRLRRRRAVHRGDLHPVRPWTFLVPLRRRLHAPLKIPRCDFRRHLERGVIPRDVILRSRAFCAISDLHFRRVLLHLAVDVRRIIRNFPSQTPASGGTDIPTIAGRQISYGNRDGLHLHDQRSIKKLKICSLINIYSVSDTCADHNTVIQYFNAVVGAKG